MTFIFQDASKSYLKITPVVQIVSYTLCVSGRSLIHSFVFKGILKKKPHPFQILKSIILWIKYFIWTGQEININYFIQV